MESCIKYKLLMELMEVCSQNKLPVGEFECHRLSLNFKDINFLLCHLKEIAEISQTTFEKDEIISNLFELNVSFGLVGSSIVQERDLKPEDFPFTAKYAESCFRSIKKLLEDFQDVRNSSKRLIYINSLILCATHSQEFPWSTKNTVTLGLECVNYILESTNHQDVGDLLCSDSFHPTLLKGVLKKTRPLLLKDSWSNYPSSPYIFSWFLHHVKHPYLVDYLSDVFPPPCMFISDYMPSHQVLAVKCFHHILDNVPPTLIGVDGKEDVVWSVLVPHMYSAESDIIEVLWPCLLKLPSLGFQKMKDVGWSRYDDALEQLLRRTEMESSVKVKSVYLFHVHSFVQVSPPFKHLKHLLKVIEENFYKDVDILCKILSLKILKDVIKFCWPSMKRHCFKILKNMCILLYDLEHEDKEEYNENIEEMHILCSDILAYLKYACPDKFKILVAKYIENDIPGVKIFKEVLEKEI